MITTLTAYGILLTDEFGKARRVFIDSGQVKIKNTQKIVDLIQKHASQEDDESMCDYDTLPWLVTQWSAEDKQLLIGMHVSITAKTSLAKLRKEWDAVYQTVPEEIKQAIVDASLGNPDIETLSGEI